MLYLGVIPTRAVRFWTFSANILFCDVLALIFLKAKI
jgi:hypothetical protein